MYVTFTQDDAHIFVRPDQIKDEINRIIELIDKIYQYLALAIPCRDYLLVLKSQWAPMNCGNKLQTLLRSVLEDRGMEYRVNEGDGAFYGPKIDFHVLDAIKRTWQCGTIQLDFQMPEKFDCTYIGEDNQKHTPVVIHRVIYGSIERFMAVLIEHYAGAFPNLAGTCTS